MFALAVNRDRLAHSIRSLYGNDFDGAGYLRRFFDIDLRLPEPSRERFIEQALSSIQLDGYFDRTLDQHALGEYRQIKLLFSAVYAASDVSLRTINQAIHHLGFMLATLRPKARFLGYSAAVALILRIMDQVTYREFMSAETEDTVVAQRIFAKIDVDDERWEHQRALFEAVLIIGTLEIWDERSYLRTGSATALMERYQNVLATDADGGSRDRSVVYARRVLNMVKGFSPNPPKRWAVALTPGMMGKGRRTGQARFQ